MNFSDIDFGAIGDMMKNLSSEDMDHLNQMAEDMMSQMRPSEEEVPEVDYTEGLHLSEEYEQLPGTVLNQLEAAWDMENFYDPEEKADYSAAALFFAKALLQEAREKMYPVFRSVLPEETASSAVFRMRPASMSELKDYSGVLFDQQAIDHLVSEEFGTPEFWQAMKSLFVSTQTVLSRAEFDSIGLDDLAALKSLLLGQEGLLLLHQTL